MGQVDLLFTAFTEKAFDLDPESYEEMRALSMEISGDILDPEA